MCNLYSVRPSRGTLALPSAFVSNDQEARRDAGWWLRDRAAAVESLASEMIVPEAKREMETMAKIYKRVAERTESRAGFEETADPIRCGQ